MNEKEIDELMEYNLEYLEARNSEDIFGGDYTSQVDLKYANKKLEQLQQENKQLKQINEQHQKLNGELRTELNDIKDLIVSLQESCKQLDVSGLTICNIILEKIEEMEK